MLKNGQTYFKLLRCEHQKISKVRLAIFQHYSWKVVSVVSKVISMQFD